MVIKNQSRSGNWNWKVAENTCNQTSPMQSISLTSQLQLRDSWEHVNVGLYFNLTLPPAEQHLPQRCPLSCFPLGRVCLEPVSLCLTVFSPFSPPPPSTYTFVCKTASFPRLVALPGCVAENVWHGESLHFLHLKSFLTWWKPFVFSVS